MHYFYEKKKIGVNVHLFHLFDIERGYIDRCWCLAENMEIKGISKQMGI